MRTTQVLILATILAVVLSINTRSVTGGVKLSACLSASLRGNGNLDAGLKALFTIFAHGHQKECKYSNLDKCTAKDREAQFCTRGAYQGCICYNNGICTDA